MMYLFLYGVGVWHWQWPLQTNLHYASNVHIYKFTYHLRPTHKKMTKHKNRRYIVKPLLHFSGFKAINDIKQSPWRFSSRKHFIILWIIKDSMLFLHAEPNQTPLVQTCLPHLPSHTAQALSLRPIGNQP